MRREIVAAEKKGSHIILRYAIIGRIFIEYQPYFEELFTLILLVHIESKNDLCMTLIYSEASNILIMMTLSMSYTSKQVIDYQTKRGFFHTLKNTPPFNLSQLKINTFR